MIAQEATNNMPVVTPDCSLMSQNGEMYWRCIVSASGSVDVAELPDLIDQPVIMTARGQRGAHYEYHSTPGEMAGSRGVARTVIDGGELHDEGLYVYLQRGAPPSNSYRGGSATVVSKQPLENIGRFDVDEIYLIAAGGGAQGKVWVDPWHSRCGGGSGGNGGIADAAQTLVTPGAPGAVSAPGGNASFGKAGSWCPNGRPPTPGYDGYGGIQFGDRRSDGTDGIGGVGGGSNWNYQDGSVVQPTWGHGQGGHSTVYASGGGGYGGGAGGERTYGGAGGGSIAAAPTAVPEDLSVLEDALTHGVAPEVILGYPCLSECG
ncbi:MAG: hypothetical protein AAGF73_12975 [Actinomycetota bacterium]